MKVKLLEPYGYCFGVKNGLNQLYKIKKDYQDYKIHILGPFVHNKFTNTSLLKDGFIIFESTEKCDQLEYINKLDNNKDIIIFGLHGYYKQVLDLLIARKFIYFDICCKFVRHNLDIVKNKNNTNYFIIGNENHMEIKYLLSFLDKNYLVNNYEKLDKNKNYVLLNQTTMSIDTYDSCLDKLNKFIKNKERNICVEPAKRYEIFKEHLLNNTYDYVFLVGDKTSANTNNLLEIYYKTTKNNNISIVTTLNEVEEINFNNVVKVLVLSGTSSDDNVVLSIYNYLKTK